MSPSYLNDYEYEPNIDEDDLEEGFQDDQYCIVRNCDDYQSENAGTRQVCNKHLRQADNAEHLPPRRGFLPPVDPVTPTKVYKLKDLPGWLHDAHHVSELQAHQLPFFSLWIRLVVKTADINSLTLLIAFVLSRYCRKNDMNDRYVFPSITTLARQSRLSTSSIRRSLETLEQQGWIIRKRPEGSVARYWLDIPNFDKCPCGKQHKQTHKGSEGVSV